MLLLSIDESRAIVTLKPKGPLTIEDFQSATAIINEHLNLQGKLKGIIVQAESFQGWSSFNAFLSHLNFIKSHHQQLSKVPLVTNSAAAGLIPPLIEHFTNAKIKRFNSNNSEQAHKWMTYDHIDA